MIVKSVKGRGASGVTNYVLADHDMNGEVRPRAEIMGGNLSGTTSTELARELGALKDLRPRLNKHIAHASIRKSPEDRDLSDDEWSEIGRTWAEGMGHENYVIVSHDDHIHVVASRIRLDGSAVSDSNDYRRQEQLMRDVEERFGLQKVEPSHLLKPERAGDHVRAPDMADLGQVERGETPARQVVQDAIGAAMLDIPGGANASEFVDRLESQGINVRANIASTGRLNGFSYECAGQVFTSKHLGRMFSLKNLQNKGLHYEPSRDFERLRATAPRGADATITRGHAETQQAPHSPEGRPEGSGIIGPRGADGTEPGAGSPEPEHTAEPHGEGQPGPGRFVLSRPAGLAGASGGREQGRTGTGTGREGPAHYPGRMRGPDDNLSADGGGSGSDDDGGSVEPAGDGKQKYKACLWSAMYNQNLPASLREQLHFVDQDRRIIALHDGARVADHGRRITTNKATNAAVSLMIREAQAKGWEQIRFTGSDLFKEKAAREAVRKGLPVVNKELQSIVKDEKKKMEGREPQPGSPRWNLAAAAGTPAAGPGQQDATDRNIARQLDALDCQEYEWQAIPPKGDGRNPSPLRTGVREDLEKAKGWLRRLNKDGFDVYVRPTAAEEAQRGLAFIDDIDLDTADRMFKDGLPVCCLIESSPGNFQGWVRISGDPLNPKEIKEVNKTLASRYAGDPGAATSRRFGRLAGFTNRKPSRVQPNGLPPYARVESTSEGTAPQGPQLVAEVRAEMQKSARKVEEARSFPVPRPRRSPGRQPQDPIIAFQAARSKAAARTDDESALDFSGTLSLVRRGCSDREIADAIRAARPALDDKKNGNSQQYIERTISRAREIAAEQQHRPATAFRR